MSTVRIPHGWPTGGTGTLGGTRGLTERRIPITPEISGADIEVPVHEPTPSLGVVANESPQPMTVFQSLPGYMLETMDLAPETTSCFGKLGGRDQLDPHSLLSPYGQFA